MIPFGETGKASQGASFFTAPNPPFGAVFTYHLAEELKSREKKRQEQEKPLVEAGKDTPFPGWDAVEAERREPKPGVLLVVRDAAGHVLRRVDGPAGKGFHRVAWDLRLPSTRAIADERPRDPDDEEDDRSRGVLAAPGRYTVSLEQRVDGRTTELAGPVPFEVERMRKGALPGSDPAETAGFAVRVAAAQRATTAASQAVSRAFARVKDLRTALLRSRAPDSLDAELDSVEQELYAIEEALGGSRSRAAIGEVGPSTVSRRVQVAAQGAASTYGPTPTHRRSLEIVEKEFAPLRERVNAVLEQRLPALEKRMEEIGAPWTPGRPVPPLP